MVLKEKASSPQPSYSEGVSRPSGEQRTGRSLMICPGHHLPFWGCKGPGRKTYSTPLLSPGWADLASCWWLMQARPGVFTFGLWPLLCISQIPGFPPPTLRKCEVFESIFSSMVFLNSQVPNYNHSFWNPTRGLKIRWGEQTNKHAWGQWKTLQSCETSFSYSGKVGWTGISWLSCLCGFLFCLVWL